MVNARLVIVPPGTISALAGTPDAVLPPVTFGSVQQTDTMLALVGLLVIAVLFVRRRTGAIVIGMATVTVLGLGAGVTSLPAGSWAGWPRFDSVLQADFGAIWTLSAVPLVLSLVMVDFFDTIGTASAIGEAAGLKDDRGRLPHLQRVLAIDAGIRRDSGAVRPRAARSSGDVRRRSRVRRVFRHGVVAAYPFG